MNKEQICGNVKICMERADKMRVLKQCLVGSSGIFAGMAMVFCAYGNIPAIIASIVIMMVFLVLKAVSDHKTENRIKEDVEFIRGLFDD